MEQRVELGRLAEPQRQLVEEGESLARLLVDDSATAKAVLGMRGLRMILEELMLDVMYMLPSYKKVKEFMVTREMVESRRATFPVLEKAG